MESVKSQIIAAIAAEICLICLICGRFKNAKVKDVREMGLFFCKKGGGKYPLKIVVFGRFVCSKKK